MLAAFNRFFSPDFRLTEDMQKQTLPAIADCERYGPA